MSPGAGRKASEAVVQMPSGFNYYVFGSRGDLAIVDPQAEARCPNPKAILVNESAVSTAIDGVWSRFSLEDHRTFTDSTPANAFNISQILVGVLPSAEVCAYHLGRGMAAAVLEVLTGFPGNGYAPFVEPLNVLIAEVARNATDAFVLDAQEWCTDFISVSARGGSHAFSDRWNATNPIAMKPAGRSRRWWR